MSRENILVKLVAGASLVGGGIFLGGCEAKQPTPILPPNSPTRLPTETPVPSTLTPVLPTPTRVIVGTPTREIDPKIRQGLEAAQSDDFIRSRIEQAKSGEILILENVFIKDIIRIPWEGKEAYIATLYTTESNLKSRLTAVVMSSDCIFDSFRDAGDLGPSTSIGIGRIWQPTTRLRLLSAKTQIATGTPILNAEQISHKGNTRSCKETTAFEKLRGFVSRVNWREMPQDTARLIGWFTREFIEGLRQGFSTPTPTH